MKGAPEGVDPDPLEELTSKFKETSTREKGRLGHRRAKMYGGMQDQLAFAAFLSTIDKLPAPKHHYVEPQLFSEAEIKDDAPPIPPNKKESKTAKKGPRYNPY